MSDKHTQKITTEGERIKNFIEGEDWKWVKDLFDEKIKLLTDIRTIEDTTPEQKTAEMDKRIGAVSVIEQVLEEIEGKAQQYKEHQDTSEDDEDHIKRLGDSEED